MSYPVGIHFGIRSFICDSDCPKSDTEGENIVQLLRVSSCEAVHFSLQLTIWNESATRASECAAEPGIYYS